ncbi:hypothetical protein TrVE_jg95 [Triparma verrucosa]|uniref:Protein kinase domain-containing protein n=1 Tax=Triparma verrucosa TaxID=1606542 RepID=A0A9W7FDN9_9STRA|nr:hypothetical protein TrVE_jg95 [Triparma verrucosa]
MYAVKNVKAHTVPTPLFVGVGGGGVGDVGDDDYEDDMPPPVTSSSVMKASPPVNYDDDDDDDDMPPPPTSSFVVKSTSSGNAMCHEATIHSTLNHPNVTLLYELITNIDSTSLVLEYAPLGPLSRQENLDVLKNSPILYKSVIPGLLSGLSYLQSKSIAHRDIKPDNILLSGYWNVRISDFGSAKQFGSDSSSSEIVGTVGFLSPEECSVVVGEAPSYDAYKGDLWSAGMSLLFCLGALDNEGFSEESDFIEVCEKIARREGVWSPEFLERICGGGDGRYWGDAVRFLICDEEKRDGDKAAEAAASKFDERMRIVLKQAKVFLLSPEVEGEGGVGWFAEAMKKARGEDVQFRPWAENIGGGEPVVRVGGEEFMGDLRGGVWLRIVNNILDEDSEDFNALHAHRTFPSLESLCEEIKK